MSIKSDRWIKKMALEHGMIEPFVESQVRQGVISYGLSSYGYDMRVSREFKVFTNVFNTLVDPKNFDQRSFVDIEADYIDIPPNSFALARTVEYFRIPRSILAICLGKSTYARCFRGDTRVALVDGTSITLEEMTIRSGQGEYFWGYSIGSNGRIIVTLLENPRYVATDKLYDILLDNGEHIYCTPDHEFITRDGYYVRADNLRPGSSLMPLYRNTFRGYEGVYQPVSGTYLSTHRMADDWNIRHAIYDDIPGTHRHHIDYDRRNNNPSNIQRVSASEHAKSISEALLRRREDSAWPARFVQAQSSRAWAVFRHFPNSISRFRGTAQRNHKVVSITNVPGEHDVYCLTVSEAGNFALEAGVFTSNCGIILNTTPFEPGWEGYVTLEVSNTTPLPARIYANEGIGQVLFFESDEECETSYADKQGKYQSQTDITLPRL